MIRFELVRAQDTRLIAKDMRARDIAEVRAGWDLDPEMAMAAALAKSTFARTLFWDLKPLGMFGLSPLSLLSEVAQLWVFGTAAIDEHRFSFAKASRFAVDLLFGQCSVMTNLVDMSDMRAIAWMNWLGGQVIGPPQVRGGRRFVQFILSEERVRCQRA